MKVISRLLLMSLIAWVGTPGVLCAAIPASSGNSLPPATPRLALVIGNGSYTDVVALKNPGNDARDMCQSLHDLGYQTFCYTDVGTRVQLRSIVEDFAEKLSADTLSLVYYAGHAVQISGENYLIPTAARLQSATATADQSLGLGYVMKQLQSSQALLKILIIDACRDELVQSASPSQANELSRIEISSFPDNSFVLYSTASNDVAADGQGRNGTLTKNLLAHMRESGDLNDLFNAVANGVREDTAALGHTQSPEIRRNSTLRYCLVRCTALEELQANEEAASREIAKLRLSVAAGDKNAEVLLQSQIKYQADLKKKDEQMAQKAKERQDKSFVPPSF